MRQKAAILSIERKSMTNQVLYDDTIEDFAKKKKNSKRNGSRQDTLKRINIQKNTKNQMPTFFLMGTKKLVKYYFIQ